MLTSQIHAMLELQDKMNTKVHQNWRQQGYEWYRAIWVECAELLDHYGWKWWKKQECDRPQVILELIDIWHFGLSDLLAGNEDLDSLVAEIAEQMVAEPDLVEFRLEVEQFALATLSQRKFDLVGYKRVMLAADLSFDVLYRQYIGKNVLNFFRQDHGYKAGTYRKQWQGREDNEHLVEVLEQIDPNDADFQTQIYTALERRYSEVTF